MRISKILRLGSNPSGPASKINNLNIMLKKIKNPITIFIDFFREVFAELKKVEYLSRSKTIRYSIFIIIALIISTIFLIAADKVLFAIRNLILQF